MPSGIIRAMHVVIVSGTKEAHLIRAVDVGCEWWAWMVFNSATGEMLHKGYGEASEQAARKKAEEHLS